MMSKISRSQSGLIRIVYYSRAREFTSDKDRQLILKKATQNNSRNKITGALFCSDHRYLQLIEGEEKAVTELFEKIKVDPRHHHLEVLQIRSIESRSFPKWSMTYNKVDDIGFYQAFYGFCLDIGYSASEKDPSNNDSDIHSLLNQYRTSTLEQAFHGYEQKLLANRHKRIFIISYDEDTVAFLNDLFKLNKPSIFDSATNAINFIERSGAIPDMIFLDVAFMSMSGIELNGLIQALSGAISTAIIVISSVRSTSDEEYCFDHGADDFITKPLSQRTLLARVHQHFRLQNKRRFLENDMEIIKKYESIIKSSGEAIISVGRTGIIQSWNPGAEKIFGYSAAEMVGKPMVELYQEDNTDSKDNNLPFQLTSDGSLVEYLEMSTKHKNGGFINLSITVSPVYDVSENPNGFSIIAKDVTEQVRLANLVAYERSSVEAMINHVRASLAPRISDRFQYHLSSLDSTSGDMVLRDVTASGREICLLADFTGHGMTAAVMSPMVASLFLTETQNDQLAGNIFSRLNRLLCEHLPTGHFMSAILLEIDPASKKLSIWNGGLPPIRLFEKGCETQVVHSSFTPLGIDQAQDFTQHTAQLTFSSGMSLIMYSDGLSESMLGDSSLNVESDLVDWIASRNHLNHSETLEQKMQDLMLKIAENQNDDLTVVLIDG